MNTRPTLSVVTDDGLVERVARALCTVHDPSSDRYDSALPEIQDYWRGQARAALAASDRDVLVGRIAELEQQLEDARPKYAQSCFDHEYITPGCPDCGKMA